MPLSILAISDDFHLVKWLMIGYLLYYRKAHDGVILRLSLLSSFKLLASFSSGDEVLDIICYVSPVEAFSRHDIPISWYQDTMSGSSLSLFLSFCLGLLPSDLSILCHL